MCVPCWDCTWLKRYQLLRNCQCMRERIGIRCWQRSLFFLSFFSCHGRPLRVGNKIIYRLSKKALFFRVIHASAPKNSACFTGCFLGRGYWSSLYSGTVHPVSPPSSNSHIHHQQSRNIVLLATWSSVTFTLKKGRDAWKTKQSKNAQRKVIRKK